MKYLLFASLASAVSAGILPDNIDKSFGCAAFSLASEFADQLIGSDRVGLSVFEALQLGSLCGFERQAPLIVREFEAGSFEEGAVCVDALQGDDANTGSCPDSPLRTLHEAVERTKMTIYLNANGVHHLKETIVLDSSHSGLTITGYPDDPKVPVVSGLAPLDLEWTETGEENVWVANLDVEEVPGLFFEDVEGGKKRGIVARFPNTANPFKMNEEYGGDQRISENVATFIPPKGYTDDDFQYLFVESPARTDTPDGWFQNFQAGIGGSCEIYDPPVSYWCSNATQGGGAFQYKVPRGVKLEESFLPNLPKYTEDGVKQAVLNAWRPARWENWMFTGDIDLESNIFTFTGGGNQGARGEEHGGDWFIENVREELDFPDEYWFDPDGKQLFFYLNETEASHPDDLGDVGIPSLECLFNLTGSSPSDAVVNVTISGIMVAGTAHTYLSAPHTVPSGGDWSLERAGAIFIENTEGVLIEGLDINYIDGHGVTISGYNRGTQVRNNEISWVGGSAIVSWGRTDEELGNGAFTANLGLYPDGNIIEGNLIHEVGHFEKQNSFYIQAKTARSLIQGNVMFNGPRAGINYNDGFTGGDVLRNNLVFNTCRESSDHGPFNSWDRQPFLTPGSPDGGVGMDWREISGNFLIANYQSQDAIDNDDGSAYYNSTGNFLLFSENGLKSDFGGHSNWHVGNVYGYVGKCLGDGTEQLEGMEDHFEGNKCVLLEGGAYATFDTDDSSWPVMGGNEVYGGKEGATVNGQDMEEFQNANPGVDDGSKWIGEKVDNEIVIGWGRELLGLE